MLLLWIDCTAFPSLQKMHCPFPQLPRGRAALPWLGEGHRHPQSRCSTQSAKEPGHSAITQPAGSVHPRLRLSVLLPPALISAHLPGCCRAIPCVLLDAECWERATGQLGAGLSLGGCWWPRDALSVSRGCLLVVGHIPVFIPKWGNKYI